MGVLENLQAKKMTAEREKEKIQKLHDDEASKEQGFADQIAKLNTEIQKLEGEQKKHAENKRKQSDMLAKIQTDLNNLDRQIETEEENERRRKEQEELRKAKG